MIACIIWGYNHSLSCFEICGSERKKSPVITTNFDFYFSNVFSFSSDSNCLQASWLPLQRWGSDFVILGQDDGLVPIRSAMPTEFRNLGISDDCHTNLLSEQLEYDWAKQILLPE